MRLKIIYKSEEGIETVIDRTLTTTLSKLGFKVIGRGFNFRLGERDLRFIKKKKSYAQTFKVDKTKLTDDSKALEIKKDD